MTCSCAWFFGFFDGDTLARRAGVLGATPWSGRSARRGLLFEDRGCWPRYHGDYVRCILLSLVPSDSSKRTLHEKGKSSETSSVSGAVQALTCSPRRKIEAN